MTFPRPLCPAMVVLLSLSPLLHPTMLRSQDRATDDETESSLPALPVPGMSDVTKKTETDQITIVETVVATALPSGLTENFPIGRMFHGVMIPSYTDDVLKSVMRADSVVRVDETYLDLVNLTVQVYNAKGKPETTISMAEASYDLTLGELASKTPSRIEQPRFSMTGQKLIYQSASRIATMKGKVRLVVPDVGGLASGIGLPGTGK
ncbi:MAG: LPS export ABC transporter periplasmic protein LptC [Verrucomicrobiales bacterium]|jgi:hypothetical protein|nr:LPS export ABC transporter periplasmic protein LptC [Verrucomicrobiales bacterium]MBP9225133.1 LPS export ABC transporter periplasmic protein LptC [Verrucomicrobiales bacterium]